MDPLKTKRFFLAGVAIGVVAMSATGLAAARLIESPNQLAARSAVPAASLITGVTRMRILTNNVVLAGIVRAGKILDVTASAPYPSVVVTDMRAKQGGRVWPGHVIAEIDGRPIILLRGTLPAYRDLREGDSGPDVAELQAALIHLGYADFDSPGFFGPGTAFGLGLLYEHLGYTPPTYRPRVPRVRKHVKPPPPTPYLPMNEVSYIPAASALVISAPAATGSEVGAGQIVLRLAVGKPYVTGMLSVHQVSEVKTGIPARIAWSGTIKGGVIARISAIPADAAASKGAPEYPVVITSSRPLPQRLIGSAVRLTLLAPVTGGPVLTVPLTAVFSVATRPGKPGRGRSVFVVVIAANGRRTHVPVTTGPATAGFVAVQPSTSGALVPGDRVLIGVGR